MEKISGQNSIGNEKEKFNSPQEELDFLRAEIERKQKEIISQEKHQDPKIENTERSKIYTEQIRQYAQIEPKEILPKTRQIKEEDIEKIVLDLEPRDSDEKMGELLGLLDEKGIKNTLTIIQKMDNSSLEDDFHRVLVQYVKKGYSIKNLKEKSPLFKTLKMTLYEISLPDRRDMAEKTLKELVSSMEQFYAGMLVVSDPKNNTDNCFSL